MSSGLIKILVVLILSFSVDKVAAAGNKNPDCGTTREVSGVVLNVTHRLQLNNEANGQEKCVLKFTTAEGYGISLTFAYFQFFNADGKCTTDYLQFGNGEPQETKKYCTSTPTPFRSNQNKLFIQYEAIRDGSLGFTALLEKKKLTSAEEICPKVTIIDDDFPHDASHLLSDGTLQTGESCTMQIQTDEQHVLKVEFRQIDFARSNKECTLDYVKFGDTDNDLSKPYCKLTSLLALSAGPKFIIVYQAKEQGSIGYNATVTRIKKPQCSETITLDKDSPTEISHELYKLTLVYNQVCTTIITAPKGFEIELKFHNFDFPTTPCNSAYVQYGSGEPKDTEKHCGERPYPFLSQESKIFVRYFVGNREALGFSATVQRIPADPSHTALPSATGQPTGTGTPSTAKQTSTTSKTTRTYVNSAIMATVLFLLTSL